MNIVALISGGKDSIYSIIELLKKGYSITYLLCIIPDNKESYLFHSVNLHIVKYISFSIGIPLMIKRSTGLISDEINDLKNSLKFLKDRFCIDSVCVGVIQSNYQKNKISSICNNLNLNLITPLWNRNIIELLENMVTNMDIRIVSVAADGFNESWLGKKLTKSTINELKKLSDKYKINIIGEGGEFETIVLNAPFFNYNIEILNDKKIWKKNYGYYIIEKIKLLKK